MFFKLYAKLINLSRGEYHMQSSNSLLIHYLLFSFSYKFFNKSINCLYSVRRRSVCGHVSDVRLCYLDISNLPEEF